MFQAMDRVHGNETREISYDEFAQYFTDLRKKEEEDFGIDFETTLDDLIQEGDDLGDDFDAGLEDMGKTDGSDDGLV